MRRPSAVVVNEKDEIFVKDDNCLYHFDADGKFIKTMGKRMMNAPYGLGMTKEGDLVVVDALYSNGRMHVFQQDGAMDTFPYQPLRSQHEDSKCRFLAVHGQEVLTSDLGRSCLYVTNQRGELSKVLGRRGKRCGELNEPAGVAVDSVGNWVVADSKNHRVQVFAENGYFMAMLSFTGEAIRRPSGIHLTSDGLLYVINYLDSVIKVFKLGAS
ncbi:E3 ubiquitin-protein ligase TRIM32-like isoform X1 [Babylonia areolata]